MFVDVGALNCGAPLSETWIVSLIFAGVEYGFGDLSVNSCVVTVFGWKALTLISISPTSWSPPMSLCLKIARMNDERAGLLNVQVHV